MPNTLNRAWYGVRALSWVSGDLSSSLGLAYLICFILLDHGIFVHRIETKISMPHVALYSLEGRTGANHAGREETIITSMQLTAGTSGSLPQGTTPSQGGQPWAAGRLGMTVWQQSGK